MEGAHGGERRYTLDEKRSWLQKGNWNRYLIGRATQAGGVRDDSNQGAVLVSKRHADHQSRASFSAIPKSISQTSPRRGIAILFLEGFEQGGGGTADFFIFQWAGLEGQGSAQHLFRKRAPFLNGQVFESLQQCLGIAAHGTIIPAPRPVMKEIVRSGGWH